MTVAAGDCRRTWISISMLGAKRQKGRHRSGAVAGVGAYQARVAAARQQSEIGHGLGGESALGRVGVASKGLQPLKT